MRKKALLPVCSLPLGLVCVCVCVCVSWSSSSRFQSSPPYNQLLSVASIHVERPALLCSSPRRLHQARQGLRYS